MNTDKKMLSAKRLRRLRAQGYVSQSNEQLNEMAFGIRFPYRSCVFIIAAAIVTQSITLFAVMFLIALLGIFLPNHPFDYIYNYVLSGPMNKPELPLRSKQLKFACTIATTWLAGILILMTIGATTPALIMATVLGIIALFPATIDLCIPSIIYNAYFKKKPDRSGQFFDIQKS